MSDGQTWELVEGGTSKIQILNQAVKEMIDSFAAEEKMETEFFGKASVTEDMAEGMAAFLEKRKASFQGK